MNKEEIGVIDLIMVVLRKWWVVAMFVVVFFASSYIFTKTMITPVYTAKGSLYSSADNNDLNSKNNYNDMLYAQKLAKNYVQILTGNTFFKNVSAESGLDYNFKQIASMVSLSALNDTEVLVVRCTNPNPEHAAIIVETVLNNAQSEVARVIVGGCAKIIDHPEIPTTPSAPNTRRNVIIFSLLGFILGAGLVIMISLLDDRVKDPVSLRDKFEFPVLAELPMFEIHSEQATEKKSK